MRRVSPYPKRQGWKYFGPAGDKECMTVNPGANGFMEEAFITKYVNKQPIDDEALRQRGKAAVEQRADGKYFENQLLKARQVNPKVIFISGWNDWAWCLQIEPAKEYGFKYVDIAARLLGREAETRPYRGRTPVGSGRSPGRAIKERVLGRETRSRSSTSSGESEKLEAPAFSAAWAGFDAPGMATTESPWTATTQFSATWLEVAPCFAATPRSASIKGRLLSRPRGLKAPMYLR